MMKAFFYGTLQLNFATTLIDTMITTIWFVNIVMLVAPKSASWLLNSGRMLIYTVACLRVVTIVMLVKSVSASQIT